MTGSFSIGKHTMLMPSFYGFISFGVGFALYLANPLGFFPYSLETVVVCAIALLAYGLSIVINGPAFRQLGRALDETSKTNRRGASLKLAILIFGIIGALGSAKYIADASAKFGSLQMFFLVLVQSSFEVRAASQELASWGTQLTYFGWCAACLIGYGVGSRKLSPWWLILVVGIGAANVIYIDRTRPTWILFTTGMCFMIGRYSWLKFSKVISTLTLAGVSAVALFVIVGLWIGKVAVGGDSTDASLTTGPFRSLTLYASGGFGYLNEVIQESDGFNYVPERSLYPIFKAASRLNLSDDPPSRILEFYYLPYAMNVGTYLEPLYRDGGILFLFLGILLMSFGFDRLAILLIGSGNSLAVVGWANLCFASVLSFFTPKFTSFPFWLLMFLALVGWAFSKRSFGKE